MFKEYLYKIGRYRYGSFYCDHCGYQYITRIRSDRKIDNCGCRNSNFKHGHETNCKPTPELKCYRKMKERCYSEKAKGFLNYGGRGIKVCDRWLESFETFFSDIGPRPGPNYSIERLDVNGDYEPKNCKWATKAEQARNKRTNVLVKYHGKIKIIGDWLAELGISRTTFYRRLKRHKGTYSTLLRQLDHG